MPQPVLLLITTLYPGGAEHVVRDLCARLNRQRFVPLVAALDGRGAVAGQIRDAGIEVIDLQAYSRWDWGVLWRLRRLLRERQIRLVHAHLLHATIMARLAARPLGIPVLSTCHIVERRRVPWHFLADRWTARWGALETCVSDAALAFQKEQTGLPENFFRRIWNGIDLARFSSPRQDAPESAASAYRIGALGRFDPQKGLDILLRAMTCSPLKDLPVSCAIGGYGVFEEELKSLAASLNLGDRVTFAGLQNDVPAFWSGMDLCVCPSRYEGFGLVPLEAMACGVPVVASAVDSLPEVVKEGEVGRLVPPEDPQALAATIAALLQDAPTRLAMQKHCRAWVTRFSLEAMVQAYEDVYDELLRKSEGV